jgi:two-component system chemotaxis response regulator CheY
MSPRVLVVDDSLAVGRQLDRILADAGRFTLEPQARNGAEAVKAYASGRPDVVLMDIVMPVMDGLQALRAILGMDARARVVMISSVGGVGEKVAEALRLGALAVVSKPFEAGEVLATLDRVLTGEA